MQQDSLDKLEPYHHNQQQLPTHSLTQHPPPATPLLPDPLLQLHHNRHALSTLHHHLTEQRQAHHARVQECHDRRAELDMWVRSLGERTAQYERVCRENERKRMRAVGKERAAREGLVVCEGEARRLERMVEERKAVLDGVLKDIARTRPFQTYLQSVIDSLPHFYLDTCNPDISDFIEKHKDLVSKTASLGQERTEGEAALERRRTRLEREREGRDARVTELRGEVAEWEGRERKVEERRKELQDEWAMMERDGLVKSTVILRISSRLLAMRDEFVALTGTKPPGQPPNPGTDSDGAHLGRVCEWIGHHLQELKDKFGSSGEL